MPPNFKHATQFFPGWPRNPLAFDEGKVYSPYGMGVHRNGDAVRFEHIWVECCGDGLQLEMPWGTLHQSIELGEQLLDLAYSQSATRHRPG